MKEIQEAEASRIEDYFQVFNHFISQYHSSNNPEDVLIMKEWQAFKKVIEKAPHDIAAQQAYVNKKSVAGIGASTDLRTIKKAQSKPLLTEITKQALKEFKKSTQQICEMAKK